MGDYALNKLSNRENSYRIFYQNMQYFFTKMKRDYVILLFLAIMWDKYFDKCTPAEKADILQGIYGKKPALGDFVAAAQICAKHCPNKKEREELDQFFNETRSKLVYNRNQEDHKHSLEDKENTELINNWLKKAEDAFHFFSTKENGYKYYFLIPQDFEPDVFCARIDENGKVEPIYKKREVFKGRTAESKEKLLYYCIEDPTGKEEVYRLSPFIHYFGREVDGIFTMYSSCVAKTHFLETEARTLFDDQISDSSEKNILSSKICRHTFEIKDFLQPCDDRLFYISSFCNTRINKSSYAQFQNAVNNSYKYNESVVKTECKKVYSFCKSPYNQIYMIAGAGGLGKTALLLNVVQKIMGGNLSGGKYDKVIFLSAKKQYLVLSEDRKSLELAEKSCDFLDFEELKYKLALYISEVEPKANMDLEEYIVEELNSQKRSVLLMLDDLDSLGKDGQDKILEFLSKISPMRLKTIITTRSVDRVGNSGLILERLDEEKCAEFLRWFVQNNIPNMIVQFEDYLKSEEYKKSLAAVSQGIPILIEKWAEMSKYGEQYIEIGKRKVFTKRDSIRYLYNTTIDNLDAKSMQLIYVMSKINKLTEQKEFEQDFLYFISSVEDMNELEVCLKRLIDTCFLMGKGHGRYELFDFDYDYVKLDDYGYYQAPFYQAVFLKFTYENVGYVSRNTIDILLEGIEEVKVRDKAVAVLLDKLTGEKGMSYCNMIQFKRIQALSEAKDTVGEEEQTIALLLGDWNAECFEPAKMKMVFKRLEQDSKSADAALKVFEKLVNVCLEKMESILINDEDPAKEFKTMYAFWDLLQKFKLLEKEEEVKALKRKFREIFEETFEDV